MLNAKRLATLSVLTALAAVIGGIEAFIPLPLPIPGAKVGLANIVTLFALYAMDIGSAFTISIVRILIVSALFGSGMSLIYSLVGGVAAIIVMWCARRIGASPIGSSMLGGTAHNLGQLAVCSIIMSAPGVILAWLPQLVLIGVLSGLATGLLAQAALKRVKIEG